jgi:photosystem II stability/assembly factor-like uncharacterized protein
MMVLQSFSKLRVLTTFALLLTVCAASAPAQVSADLEEFKNATKAWRITYAPSVDLAVSPASTTERARVWQMTGPFGGDVTALAIDPRNSDCIIVGANDGQLFRSIDGGRIWRRLRPGIKMPGFAVTMIVFDHTRPGTIYVCLKQVKDAKDDGSGGGLFISQDKGESWREIAALRGHSVRGLVQAAKDANVFVAVARDGIYRSLDHCATWQRITPEGDRELTGFHSAAIDPRSVDTIYVGTWHLPWKTYDGGQTWKLAGMKDTGMVDDSDIFMIQIDEANPNALWMSACSGVYRSTDASKNWTKIKGIPYSSRRTHVIYQHPTRPEIVFAGTIEGLWRSVKGGAADTWRQVTSRIVINAVAVHPDRPERVFIGTDHYGILISNDGGESYEMSNAGFISRYVNTVAADRTERGRIYAGLLFDEANGGFFISEDGGITWQQSVEGMGVRDVYSIYQSETRPETLYAGTNHGLFRSDDRGRNWAQVKKPDPEPVAPVIQASTEPMAAAPSSSARLTSATQRRKPTQPAKVVAKKGKKSPATTRRSTRTATAKKPPPSPVPTNPPDPFVDLQNQIFILAPLKLRRTEPAASEAQFGSNDQPNTNNADGLIAYTWNGLFRSDDEKQGWKELKLFADSAASTNARTITVLATSPHAPGLLLVGTDDGLLISRDNGDSFAPLSLGVKKSGDKPTRIRAVVFDPRTANTIYVGTTEGFFRSFDGGRTWEQRGGGMPMLVEVTAISVNTQFPDELYLGDHLRGILYHSIDRGKNWEPLDISALPSIQLKALVPDPFNQNRFYAGSYSGGVYVMSRQ